MRDVVAGGLFALKTEERRTRQQVAAAVGGDVGNESYPPVAAPAQRFQQPGDDHEMVGAGAGDVGPAHAVAIGHRAEFRPVQRVVSVKQGGAFGENHTGDTAAAQNLLQACGRQAERTGDKGFDEVA